jgi:hypothetical protein
VKEGGAPRSQNVSGERVYVFAYDEQNGLWTCLLSVFSRPLFEWSLPSPFIDIRGTQSYMHVLRDIFPGEKDLRLPVVSGVLLLEEWLLSFGVVATCPAIRSPVDDAATTHRVVIIPIVTCPSFGLTGIEGRGLGGVNHGVILLHSRE